MSYILTKNKLYLDVSYNTKHGVKLAEIKNKFLAEKALKILNVLLINNIELFNRIIKLDQDRLIPLFINIKECDIIKSSDYWFSIISKWK